MNHDVSMFSLCFPLLILALFKSIFDHVTRPGWRRESLRAGPAKGPSWGYPVDAGGLSWSHFVGICRQKSSKSPKIDLGFRFEGPGVGDARRHCEAPSGGQFCRKSVSIIKILAMKSTTQHDLYEY